MSYDILLLDSDRTIFDFDKGEKKSLYKAFKTFNVKPTSCLHANFVKFNNEFWALHEKGLISKDELVIKRFEKLFEKHSLDINPVPFNEKYAENLSKSTELIPHAKKLLKTLVKLGKRVYIVTNGAKKVQNSRFDLSGLRKYFSGVFISEEIGYAKPDARFFEYAFSHIPDFSKEKTLMVGDSESADILGAVNGGIKSCLFDKSGKKDTVADYRIQDLIDLIEIIK